MVARHSHLCSHTQPRRDAATAAMRTPAHDTRYLRWRAAGRSNRRFSRLDIFAETMAGHHDYDILRSSAKTGPMLQRAPAAARPARPPNASLRHAAAARLRARARELMP